MSELDLFAAAIDITNPVARAELLDRECQTRPGLRDRIDALIRAHEAKHSLLDPVPADVTRPMNVPPADPDAAATGSFRPAPSLDEAEGVVIAGRYKLRQQIGEGGMGTVWMADQTEPVKRKVAVKLIRVERGQSKTILARFEAERQAIALMDHPHIAKLLDAGTTETGSPFFVMELVKGVPLNDFCDQHKLTIPERLNLFTQICSAVQHAHQKGIIHRDLKPSNILVESHDGKPVPKVIDFGLAKATTGLQLTEQSLFTAFGSVMGTPLYMAPEQATFNAIDIDTRADVYALGVILYELLTGTTPLTRETLKKAALDEMLRLVREQEAPTPSSRVSASDAAPSIAASRQTEPHKLGRLVRGELDWIALKALAKERDRRYGSPADLAADVGRFLNHEPVAAGPPSARYRLRKFVRRNRPQVVAAGLVLTALLAGVVGTTWGLVEARRQAAVARGMEREANAEKAKALAAAEEERKAKSVAEERQRAADRNLDFARKGNEVLGRVFAGLDPVAGYSTVGQLRSAMRGNLVKAVTELDKSPVGEPLDVAAMQHQLGWSLYTLGEYGIGAAVLEKAVATRTAVLGRDHPDTLVSMNDLANCYLDQGQHSQALKLHEETLAGYTARFGADSPAARNSKHNIALSYAKLGRHDEAIELFEAVLASHRAKPDPDARRPLLTMQNLAISYNAVGRHGDSIALHQESLALMRTKLGADHVLTLRGMRNLASSYSAEGRHAEALKVREEVLPLYRAKMGPDHRFTLESMYALAVSYAAVGRRAEALKLWEETLVSQKARLGPNDPGTLDTIRRLAAEYGRALEFDKAEPLLREWLRATEPKPGDETSAWVAQLSGLALNLLWQRKWAEAEPLIRKCLTIRERKWPNAWTTYNTQSMLGGALLGQKKYTDAEPLLVKGYEGMKAREKTIPPQGSTRIPEALDRLIELYTAMNKPDEAKKWQAERAKYPTAKEAAPKPPEEP